MNSPDYGYKLALSSSVNVLVRSKLLSGIDGWARGPAFYFWNYPPLGAGESAKRAFIKKRIYRMELSEHIQHLIEPAIGEMGFNIVRVRISGKKKLSMQVMVEHQDGQGMTVDDCAAVSRAISALLDVEDPIDAPYTLEVSSPGIDRPLVRVGDFQRFKGFQVKIETTRPFDGRRRFKGVLLGVDGDTVRMMVDGEEVDFSHPDIHKAKLILTDDLITAAEESKGL